MKSEINQALAVDVRDLAQFLLILILGNDHLIDKVVVFK